MPIDYDAILRGEAKPRKAKSLGLLYYIMPDGELVFDEDLKDKCECSANPVEKKKAELALAQLERWAAQ